MPEGKGYEVCNVLYLILLLEGSEAEHRSSVQRCMLSHITRRRPSNQCMNTQHRNSFKCCFFAPYVCGYRKHSSLFYFTSCSRFRLHYKTRNKFFSPDSGSPSGCRLRGTCGCIVPCTVPCLIHSFCSGTH